MLESAGLRFDCLWVSGLTDAAWPLDARRESVHPGGPQKKAGMPQAPPETSAALDRRLTEEWLAAAAEVVVSWPAKEEDRDLAPSPLIPHVPRRHARAARFLACAMFCFPEKTWSTWKIEADLRSLPVRCGAGRGARGPGGLPVPARSRAGASPPRRWKRRRRPMPRTAEGCCMP